MLGCLVSVPGVGTTDLRAITYRLAPENVFPLPLHDVLHGYLRLLAPPLSLPPENIIIAGDSAGGGLGLALCMYLRDEGYKMPSALILMSPWVDLTMSCGSWDENSAWDVVPRPVSNGESTQIRVSDSQTTSIRSSAILANKVSSIT